MARVVVTRPIPEDGLAALHRTCDVHVHDAGPDQETDQSTLIDLGREADALITMLSDPVSEAVMEACPRLQVVAQYAVGYDNIDLAAAEERGIVVTNTPDVLTDATADLTFGLLLATARWLREADQYVRDGKFERWETMLLLGAELRGKTLGIIGMGRIGTAVARRAAGFGMDVIYYNRHRANPTEERLLNARPVSLDELLAESDIITLHCPLNEDSYHLIDAEAFDKMKPGVLLINTARGAVVDEAALVEALETGRLAGAGLDVFEEEPAVHAGLLEQERVVVAPHLGSATVETRTEMARMCAEAVQSVFDGEEKIPYRVV